MTLGPGVAGKGLVIEIQEMFPDPSSFFAKIPGRRAKFTFVGGGGELSPVPVSFTGISAWQEFETDNACTLEDFDGPGWIFVTPGLQLGTHGGSLPVRLSFMARAWTEVWLTCEVVEFTVTLGGGYIGWFEMWGPA